MRILSTLLALTVRAADRPNVLFLFADDQRFDTIRAKVPTQGKKPTADSRDERR